MTDLELAIKWAVTHHAGQVDKRGKPYILHPLGVMTALRNQGRVDLFLIGAVLHDTVEDTDVTLNDIYMVFGDDVTDVVDAMTRRKEETYKDYIIRCSVNPIARAIKTADVHDNLARLTPELESLRERYEWALDYLCGPTGRGRVVT